MKYLLYINLFLVLVLALFVVKLQRNEKKIAYIRTNDLISKYKGTEEAYQKFENFKEKHLAQLDSSKRNFESKLEKFQLKFNGKLSKELLESLNAEKYAILKNEEELSTEIKQKDDQISKGILNQINTHISAYGDEHHFDVIFGTIESGNILYGEKGIDITDDLLKSMNEQYVGGKK